jgi:hypothetical protein
MKSCAISCATGRRDWIAEAGFQAWNRAFERSSRVDWHGRKFK